MKRLKNWLKGTSDHPFVPVPHPDGVAWVDTTAERYTNILPGDHVCVGRPSGTHFIRLRRDAPGGGIWPDKQTDCGEVVPQEDWSKSPLTGRVNCPECLAVAPRGTH